MIFPFKALLGFYALFVSASAFSKDDVLYTGFHHLPAENDNKHLAEIIYDLLENYMEEHQKAKCSLDQDFQEGFPHVPLPFHDERAFLDNAYDGYQDLNTPVEDFSEEEFGKNVAPCPVYAYPNSKRITEKVNMVTF